MVNPVRTRHAGFAGIVYKVRHECVNEVVDMEEDMERNGNIVRQDPLAETFSKLNSFEFGHLK